MLSPNLGAVARLAGSLRERVATLLSKPQARRFYEELVTATDPDVEGLLAAHATDAAGIVWLIGAGPGSEDLLTLRAQRLLQEADVIVHDHLVPDAVIEMGRRDAERISVGKKKGHHSFTQAQINALIVRLAREGKRVARLKSGDPMVFGRAGEEIAALRKAEIAYAIVPGVSRSACRRRRHGDAGDAAQGLVRLRLCHGARRRQRRTRPLGGARRVRA